eukprot:bmy_04384T0
MVVTVAMVTCLLCHHGQIVENVSIVSGLIQSFKYIYCIHFEIKGRQKLEVDHPCVIISNHQSILGIVVSWRPFPNADCQAGANDNRTCCLSREEPSTW